MLSQPEPGNPSWWSSRPLPGIPGLLSWRRILVATGSSPWSDTTVEHALLVAQVQGCEVCFLHVELARPQRGADPATSEEKNILTPAAARAVAAGSPAEPRLVRGDIVEAILQTAASAQCDGIILGACGVPVSRQPRRGRLFNAVATGTRLPVLLVKHC